MLQRQLDPEGQELEEAVAQKTPLQQIAQLKHALFRSEVVTKLTCDMFESLKAKQQEQQEQQQKLALAQAVRTRACA
jgi:hypothetical protein